MYVGVNEARPPRPASSWDRFSPQPFSQRFLASLSPATVSSLEPILRSTDRIAASRSAPTRSLYLKSFSLMRVAHERGISPVVVPNSSAKSPIVNESQELEAVDAILAAGLMG